MLADAVSGVGIAVHVIAVLTMLGGLIALAIAQSGARHATDRDEQRELRLVRRLINPALLVTLLAGIAVAAHKSAFGQFYVTFGIVAVLVIGGVVGGFIAPRLKRMATADAETYDGLAVHVIGGAWVCVLLIVATIAVMSAQG